MHRYIGTCRGSTVGVVANQPQVWMLRDYGMHESASADASSSLWAHAVPGAMRGQASLSCFAMYTHGMRQDRTAMVNNLALRILAS